MVVTQYSQGLKPSNFQLPELEITFTYLESECINEIWLQEVYFVGNLMECSEDQDIFPSFLQLLNHKDGLTLTTAGDYLWAPRVPLQTALLCCNQVNLEESVALRVFPGLSLLMVIKDTPPHGNTQVQSNSQGKVRGKK
ncbi:hypothetical protein HJG60_010299 [Phyllostomus discolor]|uniref:Uncharacterized protein n=1 Tax=Phyllostomus discolor TaxID=89673 RepID=A0A834EGF5_9CHIR|nr:hypothetical protein HJG60_010299 [Phyllostomus discolor]